jgi:uncharacterized protein
MVAAMKSGDKVLLDTLRLTKSELKKIELDKGDEFDDADALVVIRREMKRRREAIEIYRAANRNDLADVESAEEKILASYLPQDFSQEEIKNLLTQTIKEVGATSRRDIGRVMKAIMPKLQGRADGKLVKALVDEAFES